MSTPSAAGWLVAVHEAATTLSPSRDEVIAFDLEGRPISWFRAGETFKRSLASEVFGRRSEHGDRRRWRVDDATAQELFDRAGTVATEARAALDRGTPLSDDPAELAARLGLSVVAASWTATSHPASDGVLMPRRYRRALARGVVAFGAAAS